MMRHLLTLLFLTIMFPVQVHAQLSLPFDEIVEGRLTPEQVVQNYTVTGQAGQSIFVLTTIDIWEGRGSLFDSGGNYLAGSNVLVNYDPWRQLISITLPNTGTYRLEVEANQPQKSTLDHRLLLWSFMPQPLPKTTCSSDLQVGQFARLNKLDAVQMYGGDPYINLYGGLPVVTDSHFILTLHPFESDPAIDTQQPVLLAEGPVCLDSHVLWRVRAHGLNEEWVHFWMDEFLDGQTLLTEPHDSVPRTYTPPVIMLKDAPPVVNVDKQVGLYAGGGDGRPCPLVRADNSVIPFATYARVEAYFLPGETVTVNIYKPDGTLSELDNAYSEVYCLPLQSVYVNVSPAWNAPLGVWIAEFNTPSASRRMALEVLPRASRVVGRLVDGGLCPQLLLTGAAPNGTFSLVRLIDESADDGDGEVKNSARVRVRWRWNIPADEYGNALARLDFAPTPNEIWVLETPEYDWETIFFPLAHEMDNDPVPWEDRQYFRFANIFGSYSMFCSLPDDLAEATGNPRSYGGELGGVLRNDTINYYSFNGTAGQVVDISAMGAKAGDVDLMLELLGPDGASLMRNDDAVNSLFSFFDPRIENFTLPADGLYTIVISAAFGYGYYTLVMQ